MGWDHVTFSDSLFCGASGLVMEIMQQQMTPLEDCHSQLEGVTLGPLCASSGLNKEVQVQL